MLAKVELAAPTREQRDRWVAAVERASLRVGAPFRRNAGGGGRSVDIYEPTGGAGAGGSSSRRRGRGSARSPRSPRSPRRSAWGFGRKGGAKSGGGNAQRKGGAASGRSPRRSARSRLFGGGLLGSARGGAPARDEPASPTKLGTSFDVRAGRRIVQHV